MTAKTSHMTNSYSIYSNNGAVSRIYSRQRNVRPVRHFPLRHFPVRQFPVPHFPVPHFPVLQISVTPNRKLIYTTSY